CYDTVISQVKQNPEGFVWTDFRDPEHLGECRLAAMRLFLADFETGKQEGRYVAASLPKLPFAGGRFTLAVVSHLLFLYSGRVGLRLPRPRLRGAAAGGGRGRILPLPRPRPPVIAARRAGPRTPGAVRL